MPLTKTARLEMLRSRAKQNLQLSPEAATTLEEIRKQDPDLGEPQAFGETLAPDDVRKRRKHHTEDEENDREEVISPAMRGEESKPLNWRLFAV